MVRSLFFILSLLGLMVSLVGLETAIAQEPVVVSPDVFLNGSGDNVDTIAFWTGATPEDTLMFVTSKADSLIEVWHFPFAAGNEGQPIRHESFGTSQVNGVVVDQALNKLYVSVAEPAGVVTVFTLPDMAFERVLVEAPLGKEPGIALYQWEDGRSWLYTTGDENNLLYVRDAATGAEIMTFDIGRELETVWGDEYHGVVYVPDENGGTGVYAYTPEMGVYERNGRSVFGAGVFQKDEEGILIYNCLADGQDTGNGFIVVSDQRKPTSEFEFFDRVSWDYLGNLQLTGVGNTDGIASLQTSLPGYPLGVFAAINDDTDTAVVGWDTIFGAMGLGCDGQVAAPVAQPTAEAVEETAVLPTVVASEETAVVEQSSAATETETETQETAVEPTAPAAEPTTAAAAKNGENTTAPQTESAPAAQEISQVPDLALIAFGGLLGGILVLLAVVVGARINRQERKQ